MRNNNKIERISFAQFCKLLERCQITHIIFKIFREFVPDKYDCAQVICLDNILYPLHHSLFIKSHGSDTFDPCDLKNLIHNHNELVLRIRFQFFYYSVYVIPAKFCREFVFDNIVKILFVRRIR